jgi:hypothetical protein
MRRDNDDHRWKKARARVHITQVLDIRPQLNGRRYSIMLDFKKQAGTGVSTMVAASLALCNYNRLTFRATTSLSLDLAD